MEQNRKQNILKRNDVKITILGFTALYLICMALSTYLAKINIEHDFEKNVEKVASNIYDAVYDTDYDIYKDRNNQNENLRNYINYLLSTSIDEYDSAQQKYQQLSAAVYDAETKELFAQTTNIIGDYIYGNQSKSCYYYPIQEHFSEAQQITLLACYSYAASMNEPPYIVSLSADSQSKELLQIQLYQPSYETEMTSKEVLSQENGNSIIQGNFYTHKEWGESILDSTTQKNLDNTDTAVTTRFYLSRGVNYPYLTDDSASSFETAKKAWEKWMNDEHLQNFPESYSDISADFTVEGSKDSAYCCQLYLKYTNLFEPSYYLCVRQTANSWAAAINYMKYIYVVGLIITVTCMFAVICSSNTYHKKRAALEETRRDFTNAIAHELKTPLGIIRNFAENTLENTQENKREYYQKQIIAQTEEMDKLVKEMIYISKLDSEEMTLKNETLSLSSILNEQLLKLEMLIQEKNLKIEFSEETDMQIIGDKQSIERAIWNLLINAVEYNFINGTIHITLNEYQCGIENTGTPISEEDLPHIFEMFYTSNKSRTSGKHMGLGLYLANKIFKLHKLNLSIINTETGVKTTITK